MTHTTSSSRRRFLAQLGGGAGLAGLASTGLLALSAPAQAAVSDYKAMVCLFLLGGNDSDNTVIARGSPHAARYEQVRAHLALDASQRTKTRTHNGQKFALHKSLTPLDALYADGQVAILLNIGNLNKPLTKSEYLGGVQRPAELFSHPDQQVLAQAGLGTAAATGWGGRLLDVLGQGGALDAVSVGRDGLFATGSLRAGNLVPESGGLSLSGMNIWPSGAAEARRTALLKILAADTGMPVNHAANKALSDGMALATKLQAATNTPVAGSFPGGSLGNQLRTAAQMIVHGAQQGPGRQVFYVSLGGFDTHGGQAWQHADLLATLGQAVAAFHGAMQAAGLGQKVTLFTQSEFGRTFEPNSSGTDHGWGGHAFVVGGAVQGGLYGSFPNYVLGGKHDATNRGTWIPGLGFQQMGATLGRWFGASDADLENTVFPNGQLNAFAVRNLGFMG